ncbi:NAD(P)-dependent oxidoreductase [Streptomyces sp. TG1A-8]|uniref:NAD(P)-dependent oxidoreductase n=1 Tax=Streptomyces sp. TG1A-8 TaxID=3051385 RepID=UPI00265BC6BC|nr:NAD(P)-dependent oxidoreductase [Streptomyces sp. TG1A-8]MDO0924026.1 NAD(P)-dependent oxidoreductase [Streptomyces sp. TG1A-8]
MTTHSEDRRQIVGFIGLGDQGLPMTEAITEAGFAVHTWARRPQTLDDPRLGDLTRHASVTELAAAVDLVALCVSTDEAVLDLAASIIPAMRPESIFVNHGTGTPVNAVALAELGARHAIRVIDAPVSGGRPGAEARSLTTLAGGHEAAIQAAKPVFETFSARVIHLGPAGAGQRAKLFNNALMLMNMQAITDILTLASGTGTDTGALVDALRSGSAASRALDLLGTMVRPDTVDHLFEVCVLDMVIFAAAMSDAGTHPQTAQRVVTSGLAGARRLAEAVRLLG